MSQGCVTMLSVDRRSQVSQVLVTAQEERQLFKSVQPQSEAPVGSWGENFGLLEIDGEPTSDDRLSFVSSIPRPICSRSSLLLGSGALRRELLVWTAAQEAAVAEDRCLGPREHGVMTAKERCSVHPEANTGPMQPAPERSFRARESTQYASVQPIHRLLQRRGMTSSHRERLRESGEV
jgi:hypothetical protein